MKSPWWGKEKRLKEKILRILAERLPELHKLVGTSLGRPLDIDELMRVVITGYMPGQSSQAVFAEDVQPICVVLMEIINLLRGEGDASLMAGHEAGVDGDGDGAAMTAG